MNKNVKITVALIALFATAILIAALASGGDDPSNAEPKPTQAAAAPQTTPAPADKAIVVRDSDARQLGPKGSSGVTFTEFLDFECEACAAAFPVIEQLRTAYEGKVTFVLRYFPLPSHQNSMNAAVAVEAAHAQGKLEAMYQRMYETQPEWGEQQKSEASVFRDFAKDLGLDLGAYDKAVADPATKARVQEDVDAGTELGVQGTPSFFINEQRIEPQSVEDVRSQLDAAINAAK